MRGLFRLIAALIFAGITCPLPPALGQTSSVPQAPQASQAPQGPQNLTLKEAEKTALQNHPQVLAAGELATAASEQTRVVRSAYFPQAYGSVTGAEAENGSRIAAGALNNPIIFDRFAYGFTVGQLITDFGRTHELVKSASLHANAQKENVVTSRADVLLAVDRAYYGVLRAQSVLRVAQETVKDRQVVADQVNVLAKNQLKSGLDVSFANVNLAQAQLLLIQAENDLQASFAELTTALGYSDQRTYQLVEQPLPPAPPSDLMPLISQAMQNRPELISQRLEVGSAQSFATAERDLWFPTLSAVGTAGLTPYHQAGIDDRYAAGGFNLNIPVFNGHEFGALRAQANAQARAQQQFLRDLQDRIVRDVRRAWLDSNAAYQRLSVTDQLLKEATQARDLAEARYKLGLSSIVELSQAQLNWTQAEIDQTSAKYDYQTQLSVLNFQVGVAH
jgi:outer membrane protein